MKQYRRVSSLAVSLLLITYFLSIISGLNKNLEFLKYFSPFTYFKPATLLRESKIDLNYLALSLGIIAICLVGAYVTYAKRDLYI
jgi:ABC-2 type transport system permease protein